MVAAVALVVMLLLIVVMVAAMALVVVLFLVVMMVLGIGLGSQSQQLGHKVVLLGHGGQDLCAGQLLPRGGDDGGGGVLLPQESHCGGHLVLAGGLGTAEQDAAGVADLIVVELAEVLHIHLDLVDVGHRHKAGQFHVQGLGHAFHGAGDVGQLAHAGGLDEDAVGVILGHNLLEGLAEVAHQGAADAAGVQLVDLDAGLLQKAAVNADLAELVLNQHHFLAAEGFLNQLLDERGLASAQKAGKNINFCHTG